MKKVHSKALQYTINGYSVIPVDKKSKKPLIKWTDSQKNHATEEQVDSWFEDDTKNIGIVTGKISGITVIDIDVKEEIKTPLKTFPPTYTVRTPSGGYHLYYKYNKLVGTGSNQYPQFPHVDIRNDGGYVVAPPSEIKNREYKVIKNKVLAPFPIELFKKKKTTKLSTAMDLSSGDRNQSITSLIGTLLHSHIEKEWEKEVWPAILSINKTYKPPLSDKELQTTFQSIVKKEKERRESDGVPTPFNISPEEQIEINLRKSSNNIAYKDLINVKRIISQHPYLKDAIRYNIFQRCVEYNNEFLGDSKLIEIQGIIQEKILPSITKNIVDDAVEVYAHENEYDEVLTWVKSLKWDGEKRLDSWLTKACYVENNEYHQSVGAQWLLGLMKRILYPGCIFDHVLVFIGPQGIGKTSVFRILGGDWYKSYSGAFDNKDFYMTLAGAMIMDLDEGATMYKSESIKMKSMITQHIDEYRAPFARRTERHPRRFVFSMSTNDLEPFRDVTGNRRYWPVELGEKMVKFKWLENNREQLFAEAYHAITNKIKYIEVDPKLANAMQEEYLPEDEWANKIIEYVTMSSTYCEGGDYHITIDELFEKAILGETKHLDRRVQIRIGDILRLRLGMIRVRRMEDGIRKYHYILSNKKKAELQKKPLDPTESDADW